MGVFVSVQNFHPPNKPAFMCTHLTSIYLEIRFIHLQIAINDQQFDINELFCNLSRKEL